MDLHKRFYEKFLDLEKVAMYIFAYFIMGLSLIPLIMYLVYRR